MNPPPVVKSHGTSFVVQAPAGPAGRSRSMVIRTRMCARMALPRDMVWAPLRDRRRRSRDDDIGDAGREDHVQGIDRRAARSPLNLVEDDAAADDRNALTWRAAHLHSG